MKKKVFRIFAIILLAMLIRHFYPKSELLQPELSKMQEQIEENWDNGMPRPNDEVITTEKELS
ncbi:MAG: hypothetical protein LBI53_04050 [Candidatus Peribacteria bacterium]|jgi:hypothetical protein|nr:hypothetical protein [Candidatus Peribacteria bacterium]